MDLGGPPGARPQTYWTFRMAEILHWKPDDLEDLTLKQIHEGFIYAHGEE